MAPKVILIQSEGLGRGDDALGAVLMASFLRALGDNPQKPQTIAFWNGGVRLMCEGSGVLGYLKKLETQGVEIVGCTTCLEYFDLADKLMVGKPTTMVKSVRAMMASQDTICL